MGGARGVATLSERSPKEASLWKLEGRLGVGSAAAAGLLGGRRLQRHLPAASRSARSRSTSRACGSHAAAAGSRVKRRDASQAAASCWQCMPGRCAAAASAAPSCRRHLAQARLLPPAAPDPGCCVPLTPAAPTSSRRRRMLARYLSSSMMMSSRKPSTATAGTWVWGRQGGGPVSAGRGLGAGRIPAARGKGSDAWGLLPTRPSTNTHSRCTPRPESKSRCALGPRWSGLGPAASTPPPRPAPTARRQAA